MRQRASDRRAGSAAVDLSGGSDPLAALAVIDRLEVGPVRVEPRRITAPYLVVRDGREVQTELVYRYEEDVFDAGDAASVNLAAMVTAQVALNYGLFCDTICYRGPFDRADRQFLEDMARNTAREIFVKKFLEPNPFLTGVAAGIDPIRKDSYLRATLRFEDLAEAAASRPKRAAAWRGDRARHLILSSGGKDSLLSYGILREAGLESHPVFINESGRHWFTALNAYRHFRAHIPETSRVWTNADRVFAWFLRHLPFIRRDFLDVRADEYPIRLWTVAVFLFGALPIAWKRGIGRIIIGDEYDTTERTSFAGITHYNGLFDQSRYFDHALTRYYTRKGWPVSQFSLLRPMSELLIEKTLAQRYPDLLAIQTSCHATHKEGDRVRPCGRCEKCRRIVGMLEAVGADPTLCGYTPDQIERCMRELVAKGVHQEPAGAEHLAFLLFQRGRIERPQIGTVHAKERSVIESLRFDVDRSPVNSIPTDLRRAIYPILLEHAVGAVQRSGKMWAAYDPLAPAAMSTPYPFERTGSAPTTGTTAGSGDGGERFILGELTWPEAQARFRHVDIALLPVGAIEQHGPHLPLDTDAFDAAYLARRAAEGCSAPRPLVLPLIPYGVSYHHDDFAGTISITNDTLSRLVYEVGLSTVRNGVTKLIIVNGHGGNIPSLHFAAQMINRDAHIFTCVETGETSDTDIAAMTETPGDIHAGEIETSTSLAIRPELVQMDKAKKNVPRFSSRYLDFSSKRSVDWYARTARLSRSGVMGDPTRASREKGERMWAVMIRNLVEFIEHIKRMSVDEIHQRNRY